MSPYVVKPLIGPCKPQSTPPTTPEKAGIKRKRDSYQGLSTPQKSQQVKVMIRDFLDAKAIDPTMRLLFRKICKGLDEQAMALTTNALKIRNLERQNKHLQPRKRAKINQNPNMKFSKVDQLDKEARRVEAIPDHIPAPSELENYIFEELCFQ